LWPQTFNVICGLRPDWFILENVRGLLTAEKGEIFGRILSDLASIGYNAEWEVLPARAFGAPHKRDRIFVVAYPVSKGLQRPFFEGGICSVEKQASTEFGNRSIACGSWWFKNIPNIRMGDGVPLRLARHRVKSYGNAVCPPVIEFLANRILEVMERL
jgi:DNA (cytosine-5)-methyltransferase 1